MKRFLLTVIAAVLLIPISAVPSAAGDCDPKSQLVSAAAEAGVRVHTEELMVLTHGEDTFAAAPIQGFENIPSTALAGGVDMAFAYINFPGSSRIPPGNYILRGRAPEPDIREGQYEGTIEIVSLDGEVVTSIPAQINTFSLTVPDPLPYPRPVITGAWKTVQDVEGPHVPEAVKAKGMFTRSTSEYIFIQPWMTSRGWPVRYVFVRIVCSNGAVFEGFVAVSP